MSPTQVLSSSPRPILVNNPTTCRTYSHNESIIKCLGLSSACRKARRCAARPPKAHQEDYAYTAYRRGLRRHDTVMTHPKASSHALQCLQSISSQAHPFQGRILFSPVSAYANRSLRVSTKCPETIHGQTLI